METERLATLAFTSSQYGLLNILDLIGDLMTLVAAWLV